MPFTLRENWQRGNSTGGGYRSGDSLSSFADGKTFAQDLDIEDLTTMHRPEQRSRKPSLLQHKGCYVAVSWLPEALLWRRVVVVNTDWSMVNDTATTLMSAYCKLARGADAKVWTFKDVDKAKSFAWTYFFSPEAAEVARTLLQNPALQVEACAEPDFSVLKEVKI
jgi:hypothetical protein